MVPLLITMDLEIAKDYNINEQGTILEKINNDFIFINNKFTIFTTSEAAEFFPEQIKLIHSVGNEIGCHGLNHGKDENYKNLTKEKIKSNIKTATDNITKLISEKPVCFRGPGMSTSNITQKVLIESGYKADFSMCSQRIDFLNTKGGDIRWLFASRLPYNPSQKSPYNKGYLPLWVIPLSCAGFPFISGMLYLFGIKFMKFLFRMLLKESLKTNKPIVYLFHSYEFTEYSGRSEISRDKSDVSRNNRSLIHNLYISDPEKKYKLNFELIKYMLSFDEIEPLTGNNYTESLTKMI